MDERGLNQSGVSKQLGVSRAIVTSWFKGDKFPKPDRLLKLGVTLGLSFQDLVEKAATDKEPVIAFRKKGTRKTKDVHIQQAVEMGQLLEILVPYVPFERMFQPPALKNPKLDYAFIQKAAGRIRLEMGVKKNGGVEFEQLISKINEFEVILIPVLHGNKENHENALHIFLPASNTTWIYLNLDSNIHDFKFWMAHELGHVLSPTLRGDDAEDFADAFAQALLFPEEQAKMAYDAIRALASKQVRINKIIEMAEALIISPITVYKAINNYAAENSLPEINLYPEIFAAAANLNKTYQKVSQSIADEDPISAPKYIEITKKRFKSPFFDMLRTCLTENEKASGFIQSILDIPILDAKEIFAELVD